MPKKFQGENSKAAEAKARKDAVETEKRVKKEKETEDKLWEDNDKNIQKKLERKEDKEKKAQEALQKKLERDRLLEEETAGLKGAKSAPAKVTRAHIDAQTQAERDRAAILPEQERKAKADRIVQEEEHVTENVNRIVHEGHSARGVDEALSVLSVGGSAADMEKHPERRMKAAYTVFEEREMARLKQEYPGFRLSQLKQMLKKEWQKSPENPFNQPSQRYNVKGATSLSEGD